MLQATWGGMAQHSTGQDSTAVAAWPSHVAKRGEGFWWSASLETANLHAWDMHNYYTSIITVIDSPTTVPVACCKQNVRVHIRWVILWNMHLADTVGVAAFSRLAKFSRCFFFGSHLPKKNIYVRLPLLSKLARPPNRMNTYKILTWKVRTRADTVQHNARDGDVNYENAAEHSCSWSLPKHLNFCQTWLGLLVCLPLATLSSSVCLASCWLTLGLFLCRRTLCVLQVPHMKNELHFYAQRPVQRTHDTHVTPLFCSMLGSI